ncbi:MAG: serpin family protein, partial [Bacteroidaceae bacterium]
SEKTWSKINKNMSSHTVDLLLPRIETKSEIDLPEIMSALGMPDAFNPDKADFSKFCDADTYIALMKQVATINLDEDGAEASAVTVIGMDNAAYSPIPFIKYFYADHPFIYIISEKSTNAIFFIGQYTGY